MIWGLGLMSKCQWWHVIPIVMFENEGRCEVLIPWPSPPYTMHVSTQTARDSSCLPAQPTGSTGGLALLTYMLNVVVPDYWPRSSRLISKHHRQLSRFAAPQPRKNEDHKKCLHKSISCRWRGVSKLVILMPNAEPLPPVSTVQLISYHWTVDRHCKTFCWCQPLLHLCDKLRRQKTFSWVVRNFNSIWLWAKITISISMIITSLVGIEK